MAAGSESSNLNDPTWTPAKLLQLSGGYWAAFALHAAVKLDVFTALSGSPRAVTLIARRIGVPVRGLAMLLNAMAAMGLVRKSGARYAVTGFAAQFLSRRSPDYLGHIILHHHHLAEGWARLHEAVERRPGARLPRSSSRTPSDAIRESFLMGMFNLAMQAAPHVVPAIALGGRKRLLDLGGGPGTYAIHFCRHNPGMTAVVYDLPTTRKFAEKTIARFGLQERIRFVAGDFLRNRIAGLHDVAWLSHILHGQSPKDCATLLRKAVRSLEPGGLILVQEFVLDDTMDGPLFPALFSLNMLVNTPDGQSYSGKQISDMLVRAGAVAPKRLPIGLPNGAAIIAARVPTRS